MSTHDNPFFERAPEYTIVHISDLHFGGDLTERGRRIWTKGFVKSHAFLKVSALSLEIRRLRRLREAVGTDVLLVVTGDVATDGSQTSLTTARAFIELDKLVENNRLVTYGLGFLGSRRIVIPGNHDRYGTLPIQNPRNDSFERVFDCNFEYPYSVAYQRPGSLRSMVFFVFDTCLTRPKEESAWNRIARGRIEHAECQSLLELNENLNRRIPSLDGAGTINVDPKNCVRIVVLHHHPVRINQRDNSTLLINAEEFQDACRQSSIDYALFGHEHVSYNATQRKSSGNGVVHYECAPSATEYGRGGGFVVFDYFADECVITRYSWNDQEAKFANTSTAKREKLSGESLV